MKLKKNKIVIAGGGFAGVHTALDLAKRNLPNTKITLVSDKPHFEYKGAMYRVVTGSSPMEVCILLSEIFKDSGVEVVEDTIKEVKPEEKMALGASGSEYKYDHLVLALGSETAYFDIPGLAESSFGFKSIKEALALKTHLHRIFETANKDDKNDLNKAAHFIVVGGGATGTELAGELAVYTRVLAKNHGLDPRFVAIDLIESNPRVLARLPEPVSIKVQKRLRDLGVNLFLNRKVVRKEVEEVFLKDLNLKTKTVIWTAGVTVNPFYRTVKGLSFDERGKVLVDTKLRAVGNKSIFVLGDAASTAHSGMAQTAIQDGRYAAKVVAAQISGGKVEKYKQKPPFYSIPVGPGWAATLVGPITLYGRLGWWLRRVADIRYFLTILPPKKAVLAFQDGKELCESCPVCTPNKYYQKTAPLQTGGKGNTNN